MKKVQKQKDQIKDLDQLVQNNLIKYNDILDYFDQGYFY